MAGAADNTPRSAALDGAAPPVPPKRPAARASDPLLRRLVWTTLFRLAVVTLLLGLAGFHQWVVSREVGPTPLYTIVIATYAVSLVYALMLRARRNLRALAFVQVTLDIALAAAVVRLTGRAESPFVFMFSLATVTGAILLYRPGAVVGTALAWAAYLPVVLWRAATQPQLATLFVHSSAFAITAVLSSYLAEQLRRTGERLAEREVDLAAITALHESIVQSVTSGIVTLDARGRITFLNHAGEQITGLRLKDILGAPGERWFGAFRPVSGRDEAELANARGERRRVGYTIFPLVADGHEIGTAIIFQDLTELRAMEAQVQRSERLADLGRLAAGLAHELRNPLASMTGAIELLHGEADMREDDAKLKGIVLREAARLNQLVTRFLEFSRPTPSRRDAIDLDRLVSETLDVFAHDPVSARVRLVRALDPTPAWCDADQVKQVVWNLLLNAAQAAGSEGAQGMVRVSCSPNSGGGARLVVEDDGPGIAPADMENIFTPFFTTKQGGTGLGLATVQRVVDAHEGEVVVESTPGRGTRCTVRLPSQPKVNSGD